LKTVNQFPKAFILIFPIEKTNTIFFHLVCYQAKFNQAG
jgi:hypothetical protein